MEKTRGASRLFPQSVIRECEASRGCPTKARRRQTLSSPCNSLCICTYIHTYCICDRNMLRTSEKCLASRWFRNTEEPSFCYRESVHILPEVRMLRDKYNLTADSVLIRRVFYIVESFKTSQEVIIKKNHTLQFYRIYSNEALAAILTLGVMLLYSTDYSLDSFCRVYRPIYIISDLHCGS